MRNLIALELSKHRKNFRSMGLLLVLSMVVTLQALLFFGKLHLFEAIVYTVEFAFIASAFLLPLYFGVAAGNALRHEPEKSSEDLLPASPLKRASAAYLAGLVYAAILGLAVSIIFGLSILEKPFLRFDFPIILLFLVSILYFHLISFLFGYVIRQPLLASGAAILAFVLNSSCFSMFQQWRISWMVEYGLGSDSWNWTSAILLGVSVLGLVIPAVSGLFLVRRMQRGIEASFGVAVVIIVLILVPLMILSITLSRITLY